MKPLRAHVAPCVALVAADGGVVCAHQGRCRSEHRESDVSLLLTLHSLRLRLAVAAATVVALTATGMPASAATRIVDGPDFGDVLAPIVLTSDGARLLFLGDLNVDHKVELFGIGYAGGSADPIHPDAGPDADVVRFELLPDGNQVIFQGDHRTDNVHELFRVSASGGAITPLHDALPSGRNVKAWIVSPDGDTVVFVADRTTDNVYGLYSVPVGGGSLTVLMDDLPSFGDVAYDLQITPDSSHVVFRADATTDRRFQLYSAPLDGSGSAVAIGPTLLAGAGVAAGVQISANGETVVMRAEQLDEDVHELFAGPLVGGTEPVLVSQELVDGGDVHPGFAISPDSGNVVYLADAVIDDQVEAWVAVPGSADEPRRLNDELREGASVKAVRVTADGLKAVFLADQTRVGRDELWLNRIDDRTAEPRRISGALPLGGNVLPDFVLTLDATRVVYRADQAVNDRFELWTTLLDVISSPVRLNGDLVDGGDVAGTSDFLPAFRVSFDGSEIIYLADQERDGDIDLYTVPPVAGGTPILINDSVPGRSVEDLTELINARIGYVSVDSATLSDEEVWVSPVVSPPAPLNPYVFFGPGSATISWDAPDTDVPIDEYVVVSNPGGITATVDGDVLNAYIEGLEPGVTYIFTVTAVNDVGSSEGSDTEPGTPTGPPKKPKNVSAEPVQTGAVVTWDAPGGNNAVEDYRLRTSPSDAVVRVPASVREVTVIGLDPDTEYTFHVLAGNAAGDSDEVESDPITPLPPEEDTSEPDDPVDPEDPEDPENPEDPVDPPSQVAGQEADAESPVVRMYGENRYETASRLSAATFSAPVDRVYLATGTTFPDALAAGAVAAAEGVPILLTKPNKLPAETIGELARLEPREVVILGGVNAISEAVAQRVAAVVDASVRRIAGSDRYDTAARLSAQRFAPGVDMVYVSTAANFPDALAAGAAAGVRNVPILLTAPSRLPAATKAELQRLAPARIIVLGGPAAVYPEVATELATLATVERVAGANRYDTAARVSASTFEPGVGRVFIAVGNNFPDALAAGPVAAVEGSPILLTSRDRVPPETRAELDRLAPTQIVILGGSAAVSAAVEEELRAR